MPLLAVAVVAAAVSVAEVAAIAVAAVAVAEVAVAAFAVAEVAVAGVAVAELVVAAEWHFLGSISRLLCWYALPIFASSNLLLSLLASPMPGKCRLPTPVFLVLLFPPPLLLNRSSPGTSATVLFLLS